MKFHHNDNNTKESKLTFEEILTKKVIYLSVSQEYLVYTKYTDTLLIC